MTYLRIVETNMQDFNAEEEEDNNDDDDDVEDDGINEAINCTSSDSSKHDISHLMIPNILDLDNETLMTVHAADEGAIECIEKVGDFFYDGSNSIYQDEEESTIHKASTYCEKVLKLMKDEDPDKQEFESMKARIDYQLRTLIIKIPTSSKMTADKLHKIAPKIKFNHISMPPIKGHDQDCQRIILKFNKEIYKEIEVEQCEKVTTHRFTAFSKVLHRFELDEFFPGKGNETYQEVGECNFCRTYAVYRKDEPDKKLAAKVFYNPVTLSTSNSLKREIVIASELNHPTIVKYIGFNEHSLISKFDGTPEASNEYYPKLIMEFVPNFEVQARSKESTR